MLHTCCPFPFRRASRDTYYPVRLAVNNYHCVCFRVGSQLGRGEKNLGSSDQLGASRIVEPLILELGRHRFNIHTHINLRMLLFVVLHGE